MPFPFVMKFEQYVSLIQRLEDYAKTNRRAYQYRVFGLAFLGYAYFAGLIALFLLIPALLIIGFYFAPGAVAKLLLWTVKLWWVMVPALGVFFGFVGGAVKTLVTKVPEPEGNEISGEQAPELFALIRETSNALQAKMPEKVQITDEFNAAVVSTPRFGLFGGKVFLRLGLPLMRTLSPEQFSAVLTHEIGHVSAKHGSFGKWMYQLHETWGRFIEIQEIQGNRFTALYERFVNWFFPYFSAYSFVLMREHEKEADEFAIELHGSKPLGESLILLATKSAEIEGTFWKSVHEENVSSRVPTNKTFSRMLEVLKAQNTEREQETLLKAIEVPTDYQDSHPSLRDRLRQIGYWTKGDTPLMPEPAGRNSADHFLGDLVGQFVNDFDQLWDETVAKEWGSRFDYYQESQKRLFELESKGVEESLSVEELIERAGLIAEKKGAVEALPLLKKIVELHPKHAEANYLLGGVMLGNDDESGLEYLNAAMKLDDKWTLAASNAAFQFLRSKGRIEDAKVYASNMEEQEEVIRKAEEERKSISSSDSFEPSLMPRESIESIIPKIKYYDEVSAVYLVRKVVTYFADVPCNVMFIELRKTGILGNKNDLKPEELVKAVLDRLTDTEVHFIAVLEKEFASVKSVLEQIEGSKIFDRQQV